MSKKTSFTTSMLFTALIATHAQSKPNFVIILADDLGFGDLSYTGSKQIPTPNIDLLAKNGILFTQGYVTASVSSPSRAGLLTGRNQSEFGFTTNIGQLQKGFDKQYEGLPVTEKTIADRLKPLGYVSGIMGKWHLGNLPQFHPLKRGFDEMWGFTGGGHDYFKSGGIECNYKTPQPISYITDDLGNECVGFIKRHKNKPFFLYASFNAPHAPLQALPDDLERFKSIKDKKRRTYCAMVYRLDVNVGKIMKALKDEGLEKNTMVIFLSDNGGPCNVTEAINAPYNGQKGCMLEGGIHVPFVISWKASLPSGIHYDNPVSSLDFAPTFLKLAGGTLTPHDKFDGVDLMPFLTNGNKDIPHNTLYWNSTINYAIRVGNWKLIHIPDRLPMLFDLSNDISEQHDLALQHIDTTKSLLRKLGLWDASLPQPLFLGDPSWKKYNLTLYDKKYQLQQPE